MSLNNLSLHVLQKRKLLVPTKERHKIYLRPIDDISDNLQFTKNLLIDRDEFASRIHRAMDFHFKYAECDPNEYRVIYMFVILFFPCDGLVDGLVFSPMSTTIPVPWRCFVCLYKFRNIRRASDLVCFVSFRLLSKQIVIN